MSKRGTGATYHRRDPRSGWTGFQDGERVYEREKLGGLTPMIAKRETERGHALIVDHPKHRQPLEFIPREAVDRWEEVRDALKACDTYFRACAEEWAGGDKKIDGNGAAVAQGDRLDLLADRAGAAVGGIVREVYGEAPNAD